MGGLKSALPDAKHRSGDGAATEEPQSALGLLLGLGWVLVTSAAGSCALCSGASAADTGQSPSPQLKHDLFPCPSSTSGDERQKRKKKSKSRGQHHRSQKKLRSQSRGRSSGSSSEHERDRRRARSKEQQRKRDGSKSSVSSISSPSPSRSQGREETGQQLSLQERLRLKEEKKKQAALMKALETPEEKRARRLAKKEAKERKKREKMGWGEEYMGYTNTDNPFGDNNLLGTFIWSKVNSRTSTGFRELLE